jgi:hypothetical protein
LAYDDPQLRHLDKVLTGISVAYTNAAFIGDQLAPTVPVNRQSDKYNVFDKVGFTVMDDIRGPKSRANEIPARKLSRDSYFAEEHALVDVVAPEDSENADPEQGAGTTLQDDLNDSAEELTDTILLNRENTILTMATTVANYATGHSITLSGGDQWSTYATSDPVDDMKVGIDKVQSSILRPPNVAFFGYAVARKLEDHTVLIDRVKYTVNRGEVVDTALASLFGIPRIVRSLAVKNTAAMGQPVTTAYMLGKDVIIAYVPPRPSRKQPAFMYEFAWPYRGGSPMPTERWFDDDHSAWKVRVRRRYDIKGISVDDVATGKFIGGYLIKNAIL